MNTKFTRNRKIERALKNRFPGWEGKFFSDGKEWHIETTSEGDFYHLYPNLIPTQADKQFVDDIMRIVRIYQPEAILRGYEQHDEYIRIDEAV
jgi:hypothetical protein